MSSKLKKILFVLDGNKNSSGPSEIAASQPTMHKRDSLELSAWIQLQNGYH
jgi:hypothetical protein